MKKVLNLREKLLPLLLSFLVMLACTTANTGQTEFTTNGNSTNPIVQNLPSTPLDGGEFNKFFPKDSGDFNVVFAQEKRGFAEAKLKRLSEEVATLSVTDAASNPRLVEKFSTSNWRVAGYPAASSGSTGTAVLVGDRFQVQVRSKSSQFTKNDRETWLANFDLSGLAGLNN